MNTNALNPACHSISAPNSSSSAGSTDSSTNNDEKAINANSPFEGLPDCLITGSLFPIMGADLTSQVRGVSTATMKIVNNMSRDQLELINEVDIQPCKLIKEQSGRVILVINPVYERVAANTVNIPAAMLAMLVNQDNNQGVALALARNPETPAHILQALTNDDQLLANNH